MPAAASDEDPGFVVGDFIVYNSRDASQSFTYTFGNTVGSESRSYNVESTSQDISLTYTFDYPDYNDTDYNTIVSSYLVFTGMSNANSILPTSMSVTTGYGTETHELDFSSGSYWFTADSYLYVSESIVEMPASNLYENYQKILSIDFTLYPYDGIQGITFYFDNDSSNTGLRSGQDAYIFAQSPIIIYLEVDEDLDELLMAVYNNTNSTNRGFTSMGNALAANSDAIKQSLDAQTNSMTATLDQVKEAVQAMSDNMEEEVASGLDKFYQDLKQEATQAVNDTAASIQEQFNVDISSYTTAMSTLYTSVSTHSDDANLVFPAGTVNLMGEEVTFWEEQEVDFNSAFDSDLVQLLLLPLRFVVYFGFGYYVFKWVGKLEDLITMNKAE